MRSTYLVGDPAGKVLDGHLWEGHLWLLIQRVVAMVIVTLLEKRVVRRLVTKQQILERVPYCGLLRMFRCLQLPSRCLTCGKQLWSSRILSIP